MMEFHPDKIEVITISRNVQYPYTLNGHQLKHVDVDVAKYLGVQISHESRLALGQAYRLHHIQAQLYSWLPSSQHQYYNQSVCDPLYDWCS